MVTVYINDYQRLIGYMSHYYFHMTNNKLFDGILIFVQVVKSGGFGAAALALEHSSSHISKEINKLESRLGVRLLNRTTRSVALTPEGEAYYEQCLQLISDAEVAFNLITQSDAKPKGVLKISCPVGFSHNYIQPIITQYLKRYPNVTLEWDLSDKHIDVVGDGFDLAIRATPNLEESTLICKRIFASPTYIVASQSYLAQHGRPYHPKELSQHHCICYSNLKNPKRWHFVNQDKTDFYVDVKERIRCNSGHMQISMVKDGMGIARLPAFYMEQALANNELEILFDDYLHPTVNVYVVYPSRKHLSPKVRAFIDLISEQINHNESHRR